MQAHDNEVMMVAVPLLDIPKFKEMIGAKAYCPGAVFDGHDKSEDGTVNTRCKKHNGLVPTHNTMSICQSCVSNSVDKLVADGIMVPHCAGLTR
jgi:hypothetical protein